MAAGNLETGEKPVLPTPRCVIPNPVNEWRAFTSARVGVRDLVCAKSMCAKVKEAQGSSGLLAQ
jgi:hypothetical protein